MKKLFLIFLIIILFLLAMLLSSCNKELIHEEYTFPSYETLGLTGGEGDSTSIVFESEATFNVLEIIEEGNNIESFSLYKLVGDSYEHFYTQDLIGEFRYCSFPKISTTEIKITINEASSDSWSLLSATPKLVESTYVDDFRVTAYVKIEQTYHTSDLDANHFSVINNVNLSFGWFDETGTVFFADEYIDETLVDGLSVFETSLANIKAIMRPGTKLVISLVGRDFSNTYSTIEVHESAMKTNKEVFAANIAKLLADYELDGVSFDYEYPNTAAQNASFLSFCTYLQGILPEVKLVTAAVSHWEFSPLGLFSLAKEDAYSLDILEMMAYDLGTPPKAYHSTFQNGCYEPFSRFFALNNLEGTEGNLLRGLTFGKEDIKIPLSSINLGLPFYSRPLGMEAYWGIYKDVVDDLGKYNNLIDQNITLDGKPLDLQYFNSYQMIYDKVTFAIDNGFGGVMVWHYSCDTTSLNPLSLWNAIYDAINSRRPRV